MGAAHYVAVLLFAHNKEGNGNVPIFPSLGTVIGRVHVAILISTIMRTPSRQGLCTHMHPPQREVIVYVAY